MIAEKAADIIKGQQLAPVSPAAKRNSHIIEELDRLSSNADEVNAADPLPGGSLTKDILKSASTTLKKMTISAAPKLNSKRASSNNISPSASSLSSSSNHQDTHAIANSTSSSTIKRLIKDRIQLRSAIKKQLKHASATSNITKQSQNPLMRHRQRRRRRRRRSIDDRSLRKIAFTPTIRRLRRSLPLSLTFSPSSFSSLPSHSQSRWFHWTLSSTSSKNCHYIWMIWITNHNTPHHLWPLLDSISDSFLLIDLLSFDEIVLLWSIKRWWMMVLIYNLLNWF